MKVLDLRCGAGHAFEGWFASEDDFASQQSRALIACPLCGETGIERLPSAPRLNLSGAQPAAEPAAQQPAPADVQAAYLRAVRTLVANTEDVGDRFSEEARRIHYGEAEARSIRGQASAEQRDALRDEGIEVMPLPKALKEPLQ